MAGSTKKSCTSCKGHIRVACKKCPLCGAVQPMKSKLESQKKRYDTQWAATTLKGNNIPKVLNSVNLMVG